MTDLVLRDVEVDGERVDVAVAGGRVTEIGQPVADNCGCEVLDGGGGALIPGLWDHHLHILALAAARRSVSAGPPDVRDEAGLRRALEQRRVAEPNRWIRATGYHESVAGDLDRLALDRLCPGTPVRLQHRSGQRWVLSSLAVERLGLAEADVAGIERDESGAPTGRIYGADAWLGERIRAVDPGPPPDLTAIGDELRSYGTVGVTDATPYGRLEDLDPLADAVAAGAFPQHIVAMGGPALAGASFPSPLRQGPVKVYLADHDLPVLADVVEAVLAAHGHGRPVAFHAVSQVALVLALTALDEAGAMAGDRIEHGAIVPPVLGARIAADRLTVVTQPAFIVERGDRYLEEVDLEDRPHLYPCASLLASGARVAGSTDAPFGHPDPWRAIAAAVERRTETGLAVGADERIPARRALDLFLGVPDDPGGPPRRVTPGASADLCLLHAPLADVLADPSAAAVRATFIRGVRRRGG